MVEVEQVADRRAHARPVVGEDAAGVDVGGEVAVDDDARRVGLGLRGQRVGMVLARERQHQPVHTPLLEQADVLGVALRVALGVGQQHGVLAAAQLAFGAMTIDAISGLEMSPARKPIDSVARRRSDWASM